MKLPSQSDVLSSCLLMRAASVARSQNIARCNLCIHHAPIHPSICRVTLCADVVSKADIDELLMSYQRGSRSLQAGPTEEDKRRSKTVLLIACTRALHVTRALSSFSATLDVPRAVSPLFTRSLTVNGLPPAPLYHLCIGSKNASVGKIRSISHISSTRQLPR